MKVKKKTELSRTFKFIILKKKRHQKNSRNDSLINILLIKFI